MAIIYNSKLTKNLIESAKLSTSRDNIPNQIADKIVPVIDVNPSAPIENTIIKRNFASNATSATVYTTPTNQDFYLTSLQLNVLKDATSTSTGTNLQVVVNGATLVIASLPSFTLTAQQIGTAINFDKPIKLDRGSNITITNSTNVANISAHAVITGYVVDNL